MSVAQTEVARFPWGAAAIVVLLAVLIGGLVRQGAEPLRLELYGDFTRSGAPAIADALEQARQGGFFATSAAQVEAALDTLPWVAGADIEFLWPDRLALRLREHAPLANLAAGGVLSRQGTVLAVPALPALPTVSATPGRLDEIAALLREVGGACAGCAVHGLTLRAGNQLALSLGWAPAQRVDVELGRPDWAPALRRLTESALPALRPELSRVAAIDLRYRHAFAVRWNAPATPEEDS